MTSVYSMQYSMQWACRVMPFLKHVLVHATDKDTRLLRGKTIECMSLVGLAVGSDKFMPDADEIMQVLLQAQQQLGSADEGDENEEDDPQVSVPSPSYVHHMTCIADIVHDVGMGAHMQTDGRPLRAVSAHGHAVRHESRRAFAASDTRL